MPFEVVSDIRPRGIARGGLAVLVALLALFAASRALRTISTGHVGVTTLFGKVTGERLDSGIHVVNPLKRVAELSVRTQEVKEHAAVPSSEGLIMRLEASLLYRLDPKPEYCGLAVRMVEKEVADAEAAIADGRAPEIAGDSYLEVGPRIAALSMTLDACRAIDEADRGFEPGSRKAMQIYTSLTHLFTQLGDHLRARKANARINPRERETRMDLSPFEA